MLELRKLVKPNKPENRTNSFRFFILALLAVSSLGLFSPLHAKQQQQKQMMKIGDEIVSMEAGRAFVRAQELISSKNYEEAASVLKSAMQLEPNSAPIRYKYSYVLLQQGNDSLASEQAKKCIELSPNFSGGWALLGEASMNLNLKPQAIEAYQKALAIEPGGENADIIREHIQELQGEGQDAPMEMVSDPTISEQNRINMRVNRALALCSSATDHAGQKQFEVGLKECREALTIAPNSDRIKENFVVYLNNYAANCVQNQNVKQAEALMTEAITFQNKGGVTSQSQLTTLKNYRALLNFLGRVEEAKKIDVQMKSLSSAAHNKPKY